MSNSVNPYARPSKKKRNWLLISSLASVVFILANIVAYSVYRSRQQAKNRVESPASSKSAPKRPTLAELNEAAAQQERERAINALRRGNYTKALASLEAAKNLNAEQGDDALLEVVRRLEIAERQNQEKPSKDTVPTPAKEIQRARASRGKRADGTAPGELKTGTLLVATEPPGIIVRVDNIPRDITPARIALTVGEHRIQLYSQDRVVFERVVRIFGNEPVVISETIAPKRDTSKVEGPKQLADDVNLDLVGLIDKSPVDGRTSEDELARAQRIDRPKRRKAPRAPPSSKKAKNAVEAPNGTAKTWVAPNAGPARLLIFRPGSVGPDIKAALSRSMDGADVRIAKTASDLRRSPTADAVIAPPAVLRELGLKPSLLSSVPTDKLLLIAFNPLTEGTGPRRVAILAEGKDRKTPKEVASMIGLRSPPRLRTVLKVEDLLSTLQLAMADAALVRPMHLELIERRTRRRIYQRDCSQAGAPLAVAFIPGGRRNQVEQPLRSLSSEAKKALGVAGWR